MLLPEKADDPRIEFDTVATITSELQEALTKVLTRYWGEPSNAMTVLTGLVNFRSTLDPEISLLEKVVSAEAGLPIFDDPEMGEAGIDMDAYGPCTVEECDNPSPEMLAILDEMFATLNDEQ